jgi:effector-binding domain-containing protein
MTQNWNCRIITLFLVVISLAFPLHTLMAAEEAHYSVLECDGDFELRQYPAQIVAETLVDGNFSEVGNEGFRRLSDYISGKNRKQQSITMTAPVSQKAAFEKIPMTAPVNQERAEEKWRITFLMPSRYSLETLPEPLDPRIKLVEIPPCLLAAIKYSGTWGRERYEDRERRLRELILQRGLKIIGEPIFARYNPPFMPWFLRRNEVLIPVARLH